MRLNNRCFRNVVLACVSKVRWVFERRLVVFNKKEKPPHFIIFFKNLRGFNPFHTITFRALPKYILL